MFYVICFRLSWRAIYNTEVGIRTNAVGKTEQRTQGKTSGIGNCSENENKGNNCNFGKQDQQLGGTAGSRGKVSISCFYHSHV